MAPRTINPDPASLELSAVYSEADAITINLRTCRTRVPCPDCGQLTGQIHSWYQRSFADLPWQGLAVRFRLHTRRWRCPNPDCLRQVSTKPGQVQCGSADRRGRVNRGQPDRLHAWPL